MYLGLSLKNLNIERNNNKSRPIEKLILKDNTLIKIEGKPYSPKKTDAKKIKKIRKMLKDGMIYKDIASELNVSIALISSYNPNKRYRKSGYKIRKLDYLEKGGDLCEDKGKTRKGKSIIHQMSESMS